VADGAFELVLSPSILDEYYRVYERLVTGRPELQVPHPLLALIAYGTLLPDSGEHPPITPDPDDDKFLLCAREAGAVVVSGDRHLLDASGWAGVRVFTPRAFFEHVKGTRT